MGRDVGMDDASTVRERMPSTTGSRNVTVGPTR